MHNILLATGFPIIVTGVSHIIKELLLEDVTIHTVNSVAMLDVALANKETKMVVLDLHIFHDIDMRLKTMEFEAMVEKFRSIKIIVMYDKPSYKLFKWMYSIGIGGIIGKKTSIRNFQTCLQKVYHGELYVENELLVELVNLSNQQIKGLHKQQQVAIGKLTNREKMVARLLKEGKSNGEICNMLKLHPSTVSSFKQQVFRKLRVTNLTELEKCELMAV